MNVAIGLEQVGSVKAAPNPVYTVKHRVYRAEGIDSNIFVRYTVDDAFSHVATVREMHDLPATKQEAQVTRSGFYRTDVISRDWDSPELQQRDRVNIRRCVRILTLQWKDRTTPGEFRDLHSITPDIITPDPGADS